MALEGRRIRVVDLVEGLTTAAICVVFAIFAGMGVKHKNGDMIVVALALILMRTCMAFSVSPDDLEGGLAAMVQLVSLVSLLVTGIHRILMAWMVSQYDLHFSNVCGIAGLMNMTLGIRAAWALRNALVRARSRSHVRTNVAHALGQVPTDAGERLRLLTRRSMIVDEAELLELPCCICLFDFKEGAEVTELMCGHVYHSKCIHEWIRIARCGCPLRCQISGTSEALVLYELAI